MEEVKRYHIIQACIDRIKKKKSSVNYVEIGVQTGLCFFKIKADKKVAVDPNFIIKPSKKIKAYLSNTANFKNKFFEVTSDEFFLKHSDYLKEIGGIDVIFIDGLHLYEQVVIDVENALKFLNPGGVILMHDCNPASEAAATRGYSPIEIRKNPPLGWTGEWNGDVWKAVVELRSRRDDLKIAVFNCDYGIGYISKDKAEEMLSFSMEEIQNLNYSDLDQNRKELLNLKDASELRYYYEAL
ncbi:class I SAM-dependent methyltransferase [Paradesertivirga mongoliensis]|uniref:Class I SAM-dependent methyltransferase n=1 Tax=Paradesertivirga mongoliensis TaxID=2100740 RepID=A0ABW4ZIG7_9SPHI|nr:class I SAM-dependent methyltransferase [Pedobacter mongoliensis]